MSYRNQQSNNMENDGKEPPEIVQHYMQADDLNKSESKLPDVNLNDWNNGTSLNKDPNQGPIRVECYVGHQNLDQYQTDQILDANPKQPMPSG